MDYSDPMDVDGSSYNNLNPTPPSQNTLKRKREASSSREAETQQSTKYFTRPRNFVATTPARPVPKRLAVPSTQGRLRRMGGIFTSVYSFTSNFLVRAWNWATSNPADSRDKEIVAVATDYTDSKRRATLFGHLPYDPNSGFYCHEKHSNPTAPPPATPTPSHVTRFMPGAYPTPASLDLKEEEKGNVATLHKSAGGFQRSIKDLHGKSELLADYPANQYKKFVKMDDIPTQKQSSFANRQKEGVKSRVVFKKIPSRFQNRFTTLPLRNDTKPTLKSHPSYLRLTEKPDSSLDDAPPVKSTYPQPLPTKSRQSQIEDKKILTRTRDVGLTSTTITTSRSTSSNLQTLPINLPGAFPTPEKEDSKEDSPMNNASKNQTAHSRNLSSKGKRSTTTQEEDTRVSSNTEQKSNADKTPTMTSTTSSSKNKTAAVSDPAADAAADWVPMRPESRRLLDEMRMKAAARRAREASYAAAVAQKDNEAENCKEIAEGEELTDDFEVATKVEEHASQLVTYPPPTKGKGKETLRPVSPQTSSPEVEEEDIKIRASKRSENRQAQHRALNNDDRVDRLITRGRQVTTESPEQAEARQFLRARGPMSVTDIRIAMQKERDRKNQEADAKARANKQAQIDEKAVEDEGEVEDEDQQAIGKKGRKRPSTRSKIEDLNKKVSNLKLPAEKKKEKKKEPFIKPLDEEWSQKLKTKMSTKRGGESLAKGPDGNDVSRSDFGTLLPQPNTNDNPSGWLNDEIVNTWFSSICAAKAAATGWTKPTGGAAAHSPPPYVAYGSQWLSTVKAKRDINAISRWSRRKYIQGPTLLLQAQKIFFPVNTGAHWTLLVISPQARTIQYLDSMSRSTASAAPFFKLAREWLEMELKESYVEDEWIELDTVSMQQSNCNDCGVFVCWNGLAVAKGKELEGVTAAAMPDARENIAAVLIHGGFNGEFVL